MQFPGLSHPAAGACALLARLLARHDGPGSQLAEAIGGDREGKHSIVLYSLGIAVSFLWPAAGLAVYVGVALMWFIPDRWVERVLSGDQGQDSFPQANRIAITLEAELPASVG